ncbi:hypothetical protein [Vulcaniibacterium gelatinicum]|uniref:hypothetical protein n=1 Tax=Vulcaniibacterium gelatinicum TaxID=2598725 RepID=UPI001C6FE73C|nr:hypothetical protein [Vulcaniibacterium gelatinicum]
MRRTIPHRLTVAIALALAAPALAAQETATPSDAGQDEATTLDTVTVTGTRTPGRSPIESLSPIDVFRPNLLERQASAEFTDQLANIAPSFNTQRFPIADGTAFVRPPTCATCRRTRPWC